MKKNEQKDTAPGAPIAWEKPSQPEEVQPGYGFVPDNESTEETFYYHSDHLGSTSYVTDDSARITQYTAYLPYGELLVDEHSSSEDMPYKFNGKELDEETGLYYYGARYMNPVASIWYGIDPLTEKYPDVSAYTYCMGNPVKLVDSDGRVVKFAPGVSEQFKKDYYTAIKHLQQHGLGASLRKLISSERVYYISTPFEGKTCYKTETKTIHWDPETGLQTDNGTVMSPTSVLNHEIGHAARHEQMYIDYNTTYYKVYAKTGDVKKAQEAANNVYENYKKSHIVENSNPYDTKEEERNIKNNEQITALKLGEIQKGRVTRTNHKGKLVITESVTSNKIITTKKHDK